MLPIHLLFSFIIIFAIGCYNNPHTSVDDLGINIPKKWSMPIHETSDNNKDWVTAFNDKELILEELNKGVIAPYFVLVK